MANAEVSVVIPVHNNAETIGEQLDGVLAALQDAPPTEIIVVDNRSTDGSPDVVAAWSRQAATEVRVVTAHERAGEPYARNVGIASATSQKILFCDGDDVVRPSWIRALSEALDSASFATGPISTEVLNEPWLANVRGRAVFSRCPMVHNEVPFAHGCNMAFRRDVLEEIGGFDEDFLAGCDQVIGIRAWQAGHDLVFVADACVDYRLRPDLGSMFRQGRSYGRYRVRVRSLIPDQVNPRHVRRANLRRAAWLTKYALVAAWDRPIRARWVWVSSQLVGELLGSLEQRRVR